MIKWINSAFAKCYNMSVSQRDKARTITSLILFLEGLTRRIVAIELRNETAVRGILDSVDAEMNCCLSNCKFRNTRGEEVKFDNFFVKGSNIRYVHIPDDVNVISTIQTKIDRMQKARVQGLQSSRRKNVSTADSRAARRLLLQQKVDETEKKLAAACAEEQSLEKSRLNQGNQS